MSVIPACNNGETETEKSKGAQRTIGLAYTGERKYFLKTRSKCKNWSQRLSSVMYMYAVAAVALLWSNNTHIQISTYTHTHRETHMHKKKRRKEKERESEKNSIFFYQVFWYNCHEGTLRAIVAMNRRSKNVSTLCDLGHFYWHSNFPQLTGSIRKLKHAFLNMSSALQCQSCWKTAKQQGFVFHCRNSPA